MLPLRSCVHAVESAVRRRRYRGSNDERADGLPLGNIRLEDTPALGLSASLLSQPLLPHLAVAGGLRRMGVERLRGRSRKRTRMSGTTALAGRCFALLRGRHASGMQFVLSVNEKRLTCAERVWIGDGLLWNTASAVAIFRRADRGGSGFFWGGLCHKTNSPHHNKSNEVPMRNDKR